MKTIMYKTTFDGCIEIKKFVIGYAIYDCGEYDSWSLTLAGAEKRARYLSGAF